MKILFITEGYPPTDGGVAISTQRLARSFTRHGCTVLVLTFDQSRPLSAEKYHLVEEHEGFRVIRVGPFFRRADIPEHEASTARRHVFDQMESIAHGFKPDVVMSFYAATPGLMGKYVARSVGVPHIAGIRGSDVGVNMFSFRYIGALREIIDSSEHVVCVNHHLRHRFLLAFPERRSTSSVIENSVELPAGLDPSALRARRDYLQTQAKWGPKDFVLTFIGMPREKKGIAPLLRATVAASQDCDVKLLIVGPGLRKEDEASCRENWDALQQQGRLHCTGHMSREKALVIASEADVVIMPSFEDGLANGLLEGMALGLAPIVSEVFKETITHDVSGWVVRPGDVGGLADAIRAATHSPEKRAAYVRHCQRHISTWHHPDREANDYIKLMRELVAKNTLAVAPAG